MSALTSVAVEARPFDAPAPCWADSVAESRTDRVATFFLFCAEPSAVTEVGAPEVSPADAAAVDLAPSSGPASANATAVPLTIAAPSPTVTAPAPSQV